MFITSATSHKERGIITSLYNSVRFFGVALGPPIFGWLMNYNNNIIFWITAILSISIAVVTFLLIRTEAIKNNN